MYELFQGDCLNTLRALPDNSVDSIVTDPPYGLSFMGKKWDYDVPSEAIWREALRVLKPGGHLLAFAGTRTQHRMAVRIEDAGFEIRDMIAWVYGSGFPKSLDVSKAIDKAAGAEREVIGRGSNWGASTAAEGKAAYGDYVGGWDITAPATDAAAKWEGWGTALKPALEPITVARKPLAGTVAANVLEHGTGALNVDGCRVACTDTLSTPKSDPAKRRGVVGNAWQADGNAERNQLAQAASIARTMEPGRWPANLIHDGSEQVAEVFGEPARFFYCAKASKSDRGADNIHPTVKPTDLMRYLCRLVTPPGGLVLDPFMGSGSTGKAAVLEGFQFIGCELSPEYARIADLRIYTALHGDLV